jgi:uncharacterized phage protein gp47/JayE
MDLLSSIDVIRDRILNNISNSLSLIGITNPNLTYGSDYYLIANALANVSYDIQEQTLQQSNELQLDNLSGTDLDEYASIYGIVRGQASQASGFITCDIAFEPILLAKDSQLTSVDNGQVYYVLSDTTLTFSNPIAKIASKEQGDTQNLEADKSLTINAPPTGLKSSCLSITEIEGGTEIESDESLIDRIKSILGASSGGAGLGDIIDICYNSHPSIKGVWVYPSINGPASTHIAIAQLATNTADRVISDISVLQQCQKDLTQKLPPTVEYYVTPIQYQDLDLSLSVIDNDLFESSNVYPTIVANGADISALQYCEITAYNNITKQISFKSTISPLLITNNIKIGFIDGYNLEYKSTDIQIISSTLTGSSPNQYYLITGTASSNLNFVVGEYIFPAIKQGEDIYNFIKNYIDTLGPAEKTSNEYVLTKSAVYPSNNSFDYKFLKEVESNFESITDLNVLNQTLPLKPTVQANIWTAPKAFILNKFAMYRSY